MSRSHPARFRPTRAGTAAWVAALTLLSMTAAPTRAWTVPLPLPESESSAVPTQTPAVMDFWRVMPAEQPVHALPGDASRWSESCAGLPVAPGGGATAGPAAAATPLSVSLELAVLHALCRQPQARMAWHAVRAQAAQVGQSRSSLLPQLSAQASTARQDSTQDSPFSTSGRTRTITDADASGFTLSWTVFDFGTRAAVRQEARSGLVAAQANHDASLQQVALAAAQAWFDATSRQAMLRLAQEAEALAGKQLAAVQARQQAGSLLPLDVMQARTAAAQARVQRVRAEGEARTAQASLARAIGLPPETPLALPAFDGEGLSPVPAEPAAAHELNQIGRDWDLLLAEHPQVVAAQAQWDAARARREALVGEGLPNVSLNISRFDNGRPGTSLSSNHPRERVVSLNLTVPLFEGFDRAYRVHAQHSQIDSKQAELDATRLQVGFEAWRSRQQLEVAAATLGASDEWMRSASEALNAARTRQRLGSVDVVEVLNAQRDELAARSDRTQARAAWQIARLRLLASLGRLGLWSLNPQPVR